MDIQTTLKIKADTKEAQKAGQVVKQAFSPAALKEFSRAAKDLEGQFTRLTKKQVDLNKALDGVRKGTKEYKAFRDELKQVETQASSVVRALTQMDRVQQRAARQQQYSPARNFGAGFAQGLGISQYIPTEPGMGYRIAGAMMGRAGTAAMAPFTSPGVGGVSQMLGAIPLVGGAASGGLQTAAGGYQAAIAYQRTKLAGLFAGPEQWQGRARELRPDEKKELEAARVDAALTRIKRITVPQTPAQEKADLYNTAGTIGALKKLGPSGLPITAEEDELLKLKATSPEAKRIADFYQKAVAAEAAARARAQEETTAAQPGAPVLTDSEGRPLPVSEKEEEGVDIRARQVKADAALTKAQARLKRAGAPRMVDTGTEFGLSLHEVAQLRNQFMQARGGEFFMRDKTGKQSEVAGEFRQSMIAQVFGVGAPLAGAFGRAGGAGGGGREKQDLLQTMAAATEAGLRGSMAVEYLETLVGLQQQAEQQGLKIDPTEFDKLTFRLSSKASEGGIGLPGIQAKRIAAGMIMAPQAVAAQGPQTGLDMMILQEAGKLGLEGGSGVDIAEGPEAFFQGVETAQTRPGATMTNVVRRIIQQGAGEGAFTQKANLMYALGQKGIPITMQQSGQMLAAETLGGDELDKIVEKMEANRNERASGMEEKAKDLVRTGAGALPKEAALANDAIRIGNEVTGAMQSFTESSLAAAAQVSKLATGLEGLSGVVQDVINAVGDFLLGKGKSGPNIPKGN
jgi:exonuclease VII small subunit